MKKKVCVVITARPSYSRIKTALLALAKNEAIELQVVAAASALLDRYGTAVHTIERDGLKIARSVFMVLEGDHPTTMAKTTGLGTLELASAFNDLRPDMVVTVADRYETMATAIAAAYMNIPLIHVQGGEVTGNIDEKVRHAITKLADLHLVSSNKARDRVIRMGENPDSVVVTGCPSIDLALPVIKEASLSFSPFERYGGVGPQSDLSNGYVIVMQHPVTTEHTVARAQVLETLEAISELDLPCLWFWPNVDAGADGTSKGIRAFRESRSPQRIHFFMNASPEDFLRILFHSRCLVGNSSAGIREAAFLGVPVVNIGSRQNGRDRGANVYDVESGRVEILRAVCSQIAHGRYPSDDLYGNGRAGENIAKAIADWAPTFTKTLPY